MSRSGLWGQLGFSAESTYGTYVAPATFLPFGGETIKLDRNYVESAALRAGRMFQAAPLALPTTRAGAGTFQTELLNKGLGKLLNCLHGNTVTPAVLGTGAYQAVHNIGTTSPYGKSLSLQVGTPQTAITPTVTPFTYLGCKLLGLKVDAAVGNLATAEWTIDAQDETLSQTLVAATYPTGIRPFTFVTGSVKRGGTVLGNILSASVDISLPQKVDRFFLGATALKAEPITNAYAQGMATLTAEFASLTLYNDFLSGTPIVLDLLFEGPLINGTDKETFKVTFNAAQARGESPDVDGPDIITQSVTLKALDDGTTSPIVITTISTDATL